MQIQSLDERIATAALSHDILLDKCQGFTKFAPGIIIFYGVKRDRNLTVFGRGKQDRFLALLGEHITIEHYENQITFRSTP